MNMQEAQMEQIEVTIEQAEATIESMNALLRLNSNSDFMKLINDGYFTTEASRLVLLRADPSLQSDDNQRTLDKSIDAVGYFRQYLGGVIQMGRAAEHTLAADQATREEMLAEAVA